MKHRKSGTSKSSAVMLTVKEGPYSGNPTWSGISVSRLIEVPVC